VSKENFYDLLVIQCPNVEKMTIQEIIDKVNLTDDQLKIAKALDRYKIHQIRKLLISWSENIPVDGILNYLPIFEGQSCEHRFLVNKEEHGQSITWDGSFKCTHCGEIKRERI